MCEDVLGVLQTLHHLKVGRFHGAVEWIGAPLTLLVDIGDDLGLRAQHDLRVILEVNLNYLVRESEHNGMSRAHPLLHVDDVFHLPDLHGSVLGVLLHDIPGLLVTL